MGGGHEFLHNPRTENYTQIALEDPPPKRTTEELVQAEAEWREKLVGEEALRWSFQGRSGIFQSPKFNLER